MKSKEPKQPRERKTTSRSRKAADQTQPVEQTRAVAPSEAVKTQAESPIAITPANHTNGVAHAPAPVNSEPPEELIRRRAYELFEQRGYQHGHHLEDWFAAERELKIGMRSS